MRMFLAYIALLIAGMASVSARQLRLDETDSTVTVHVRSVWFDGAKITSPYSTALHPQQLRLPLALPSGSVDVASIQSAGRVPKAFVVRGGTQRGVERATLVIDYGSMTAGEIRASLPLSVTVRFGQKVPCWDRRHEPVANGPFSMPLNTTQFSALQACLRNAPERITSTHWYSPELPWLRLKTTKDGIAAVSAGEVEKVFPSLVRKDLSFYRMMRFNEEVPIGFIDDGNGVFDGDDILWFRGMAARGDTTIQNPFTDSVAHYLTWEAGVDGKRYTYSDTVPAVAARDSVVDIHYVIKKERLYYLGDVLLGVPDEATIQRTETQPGEGWYAASLKPGGTAFDEFTVAPESEGSVSARVYWRTATDNQFFNPDHEMSAYLNGYSVGERIQRNGTVPGEFTIALPNAAGHIQVGMRSHGVSEYKDDPRYTDDVWYSHAEVYGRVRAFSPLDGALIARPTNRSEKYWLTVSGLGQGEIVAVDSSTNTRLRVGRRVSGTALLASAIAGVNRYSTISIGRSRIGAASSVAVIYNISGQHEQYILDSPQKESLLLERWSAVADASSVLVLCLSGDAGTSALRSFIRATWSVENPSPAFVAYISKDQAHKNFLAGESPSIATSINDSRYTDQQADIGIASDGGVIVVQAQSDWEQAALSICEPTSLLTDIASPVDYLVLTHPAFAAQARELAEYREQTDSVTTLVVSTEAVFDLYSSGVPSPHGIKNFLRDVWQKGGNNLSWVVLFGDASWDPRLKETSSQYICYIPSYGRPVSDYWYTLLDGAERDLYPEILIGRLPASSVSEAITLVSKIRQYETQPIAPWMNDFLFLTAGQTDSERQSFRLTAEFMMNNYILGLPLCADTASVSKYNSTLADNTQANQIRALINKGAVWVNYVGHGAPSIFDMDFGAPADLANENRLSFLATYSCQTAAFAEPNVISKNEGYIREPGKGFIAALGTTGFGKPVFDDEMMGHFFQLIAYEGVREYSTLLTEGKLALLTTSDSLDGWAYIADAKRNAILQYTLLGDPLIKLPIAVTPRPVFDGTRAVVINEQGARTVSEEDSVVTVTLPIQNIGPSYFGDIPYRIIRSWGTQRDTVANVIAFACDNDFISFSLPVRGMPGVHILSCEIDPDRQLTMALPDTVTTFGFSVFSSSVEALDPQSMWLIQQEDPSFRVFEPANASRFNFHFAISPVQSDTATAIYRSIPSEVQSFSGIQEWKPATDLPQDSTLYFLAWTTEKSTGNAGAVLSVPFQYTNRQSPCEYCIRSAPIDILSLKDSVGIQASVVGTNRGMPTVDFGDKVVPMEITSSAGWEVRQVRFAVGDIEFANSPFFRGFNIFVIPANDSVRRVYRRYDTYRFAQETWDNYGNFSAMYKFMQDSIYPGETVVVIVGDEAISGPRETGSLDSLRWLLQYYGAKYADSLAENTAYYLVAEKGTGKAIAEGWDSAYAQSRVQDIIPFRVRTSRMQVSSPIIGPAHSWHSAQYTILSQPDSVNISTVILGYSHPALPPDTVLSSEGDVIELSSVDSQRWPYISLSTTVEKHSSNAVFSVPSVAFIPSAEYRVKVGSSNQSKLRGDTLQVPVVVENLSIHGMAKASVGTLQINPVTDRNRSSEEYSFDCAPVAPRQTASISVPVNTGNLDTLSQVIGSVNTPAPFFIERLFTNNVSEEIIRFREDNERPSIVLMYMGGVVLNNDPIVIAPQLIADIVDAGPLPFVDTNNIEVFVNGFRYPSVQSPGILRRELLNNSGSDLKAKVYLSPELQIGLNTIRIIAKDASGNTDTLFRRVRVPRGASLDSVKIWPNPAWDQVKIAVNIADFTEVSSVKMDILSTVGALVRTLEFPARVGNAEIVWDTRDFLGNRVADGLYFIRITLQGSSNFQLENQKIMILRQ